MLRPFECLLFDPLSVLCGCFQMQQMLRHLVSLVLLFVTDHGYYVAVQFHPEYLTRPMKPSPPYLGLILAASGKLASYVAHGCRLSPCSDYSDSDYSDDEQISEELVELSLKASSSSTSLDSRLSARK